MRMRPARTKRNDSGFTLIELVVSITILGIIAVSLTGVVIEYLKVTNSTETRLNESTDAQVVSTYWQNDVSSLGVRTFVKAKTAPDHAPAQQSIWAGVADPKGCGAGSTPVVSFAWNGYPVGSSDPDNAWVATDQRVAYVAVASGSQFIIERVWCGAVSEPNLVVARNVTSFQVLCDGSTTCPTATLPSVVALKLHVQDKSDAGAVNTGYDITLTAERRQGS